MSFENGYQPGQHDYEHRNVSSTDIIHDAVIYYVVTIIHVVLLPVYMFLVWYFLYKLCIQPANRKKMALVLGTLSHAVNESKEEKGYGNNTAKKNTKRTEEHDPLSPDTSLV